MLLREREKQLSFSPCCKLHRISSIVMCSVPELNLYALPEDLYFITLLLLCILAYVNPKLMVQITGYISELLYVLQNSSNEYH